MGRGRSVLAILVVMLCGCGSGVNWFPTTGPDSPASITLTASSSSPVVGSSVTITATVKKSNGTAVANGIPVSFSTSGGAVVPFSGTTANGTGTATTTLTSISAGNCTVTASSGNVSGNVVVTFVSPITVVANPTFISATLGGTSAITATVKNTNGTANTGATVTFATDGGTLSAGSAVTDASGNATVNLTVPAGAAVSGSVFTVTATQGSNVGTALVTITP